MSRLIVLTGLDGSGTSSVATELAGLRGGAVIHTPAEPFRGIRTAIDSGPRDESPVSHYLFYLAALVHADGVLIRPALSRGDVVCVRHLIDTVISHRVAGLDIELQYETPLYSLRRPDRIFCLTVDEQERQRRLGGRGKTTLDLTLDDERTRVRFLEEFNRLDEVLVRIETSRRSITEVARVIDAQMELAQ